jgi:hypothetical protein
MVFFLEYVSVVWVKLDIDVTGIKRLSQPFFSESCRASVETGQVINHQVIRKLQSDVSQFKVQTNCD